MKVSVIVRTCNRPQFLKEALLSVELQTHSDWEVLIFDDGGYDENYNIFRVFKNRNPNKRIVYISSKEPYDLFRNSWLIAPDISYGEIMVRLDDDDILAPDTLEFLSVTYEKNPELDFSYGSSVTFDSNGLREVIQTNTPFDHPKTKHAWAPYTIPNNHPWYEPWAFYRDYYSEEKPFTSIIHAAKDNAFCIFHTYVMRTESVKKIKHKITVTSKFVDDLEFLGSLDYCGLGQASIKKILSFVRVHENGRVSDNGLILDNTNMFQENFRIRDKVDHLRTSGFLSKVIPLDSPLNTNNGITDNLKTTFEQFHQRIHNILNPPN